MKTINIEDFTEGMILAHDVANDSGQVLIPKGALLNSAVIKSLKGRGIKRIAVEDESDKNPPEFDEAEVEKAKEMYYDVVAERFLNPASDEMIKALFEAVLEQTARRVLSGK